ncbi:hypothetical protein [Pseudomonas asiatica]|uniref:hypothetical protein n=1 Tax=Pseudomonas asiatica TaxID=2219225 RepID=UPI0010C10510|nr:hypothetical protein [Pseudomonas asiatica]
MTESPFATHRAVLVDSDYAAAGFLQSFAMAMYAGAAYPMDANGLRNLDDQHMQIFQEMAASYRRHGEADPDFVDVQGDQSSAQLTLSGSRVCSMSFG